MNSLKKARQAAGFSLRQLEALSGISRGRISDLETCERKLSQARAGTVYALARALGVTMEQLLTDNEDSDHK